MEMEGGWTEKKHKTTQQSVAGVHGKDDESGFGLGGFIEFREDAVKTKAPLGISTTAFNGISFTGILVHLPLDFSVCFGGFSAAQRQTGKANPKFGTKEFIGTCLVNSVSQHCAGIATKFPGVIFNSGLKIAAFIKVAPTCLLQKGVTIDHGFCPNSVGLGRFPRWIGRT